MLTFGSLFAGIGGFDLGFHRNGMNCLWQCEIDSDARQVLAHHWPVVSRAEDVKAAGRKSLDSVDVICGGFPCQDLSVAGKRVGLSGDRSGLFWEMVRITDELRPRFLVWENVPGLLSSDDGRDFGRVLRGLADIGYFGAYRVLDAQFFGVPQRRRRVFGVFARGGAGVGRCAEILALTEGCRRHPAAGREAQPDIAGTIGSCSSGRGWNGDLDRAGAFVPGLAGTQRASEARNPHREGVNENLVASTLRSRQSNPDVNAPGRGGEDDQNLVYQCHGSNVGPMGTIRAGNGNETGGVPFVAVAAFGGNRTSGPIGVATAVNACKTASGRQDFETETFLVAHTLRAEGHDASEDGAGRGTPLVALPINTQIATRHNALGERTGFGVGKDGDPAFTIQANHGHGVAVAASVRRLTPVECCRLQGFPDWWLDIELPSRHIGEGWRYNQTALTEQEIQEKLSDSAKYRLLGNAVAVPVVEWIGHRIMATL